jgi:hypothetical protein
MLLLSWMIAKIHIYALYICLVMNTRTCTEAWCVCAVHLYYFNIRLILEEIFLPPVHVLLRFRLSVVDTLLEYVSRKNGSNEASSATAMSIEKLSVHVPRSRRGLRYFRSCFSYGRPPVNSQVHSLGSMLEERPSLAQLSTFTIRLWLCPIHYN